MYLSFFIRFKGVIVIFYTRSWYMGPENGQNRVKKSLLGLFLGILCVVCSPKFTQKRSKNGVFKVDYGKQKTYNVC